MDSKKENPEDSQAAPFIDMDDYESVVTDSLQVVGTEDKEAFLRDYLNNQELRKEYKLIGTHSGAFHCDEVMASTILLRTQEFKKSIIVRSRDQDILEQLDILYDVGGDFDVKRNIFDHHQKPFKSFFYDEENESISKQIDEIKEEAIKNGVPEDNVDYKGLRQHRQISKMSSAGLIYKYYGKEVLGNICKTVYQQDLKQADLDRIFFKIYNTTMLEIDALDNGVSTGSNLTYEITSNLSQRIGMYNSPWNAPAGAGYSQHNQFKKAMKVCEQYFMHKVYKEVMIMQPARAIVEEMFAKCAEFHPSKKFIHMEKSCPWKSHLLNLEEENKIVGQIKFVFYQDERKMFRVQAMPHSENSFENRCSIHKDYRGLRDDDLNKAAGITDGGFVHAAGFIGGAWSMDSCIKMAEASLAQQEIEKKEKAEEMQRKANESKVNGVDATG